MSQPNYQYVKGWMPVMYRLPVMETRESSRGKRTFPTTMVPGEFFGNHTWPAFPVMGTGDQLILPMMESNGELHGHGKSTVPVMKTGESSYGKRGLAMEIGESSHRKRPLLAMETQEYSSYGKRLPAMEMGESSHVKRLLAMEIGQSSYGKRVLAMETGEYLLHGKRPLPVMETGESSCGKRMFTTEREESSYGKRGLTMETRESSNGKRLLQAMETGESSHGKRIRAKETKPIEKDGRSKKSCSKGKQGSDKFQSTPPSHDDHQIPVLEELLLKCPLGLNLKKTDSRVELIKMSLSQCNPATTCVPPPKRGDIVEKLGNKEGSIRASNFPALRLRIGSWEVIAKNKGSLTARIYFDKKKFVWEFFDNRQKKKIEIDWSDITALKANCPDNGPGTLTVELGKAPRFRQDVNEGRLGPHRNFIYVGDFTDGEASKYRQHVLEFSKGVLNPEYQKLIGLSSLSEQPDIILDSPTEASNNPVELIRDHGIYNQIESAATVLPPSAGLLQDVTAPLPSPLLSSSNFVEQWGFPAGNISHDHLSNDAHLSVMDSCVKQMNTEVHNFTNLQNVEQYLELEPLAEPASVSDVDDTTDIVDEYLNIGDFQTIISDHHESLGMSECDWLHNLTQGEDLDTIPMDKLQVDSDQGSTEEGRIVLDAPNTDHNNMSWMPEDNCDDVEEEVVTHDQENYYLNNVIMGCDQLPPAGLLRVDSCEELMYNLPRIASLPKLYMAA